MTKPPRAGDTYLHMYLGAISQKKEKESKKHNRSSKSLGSNNHRHPWTQQTIMLPATLLPPTLLLLLLLLLLPPATPSSPPTLPPLRPSNLTLLSPYLPPPTARLSPVLCRRDPDFRPLSDYATCIPSLYRLYASPRLAHPTLWAPGDFKMWGPETDLGGCYILVDGGTALDVFSVAALLGPALWAMDKCFVGVGDEGRNRMAKTRVGPKRDWVLSLVRETVGVGVGNGSLR